MLRLVGQNVRGPECGARRVRAGRCRLTLCKSGDPGQPSPGGKDPDPDRAAASQLDGQIGPKKFWEARHGGGGDGRTVGRKQQLAELVDSGWRLARPYTTNASLLQATAVAARTMVEHPSLVQWGKLPRLALGLVALWLFQGYSAGLKLLFVQSSNKGGSKDKGKLNLTFLPGAVKSKHVPKPAAAAVVLGFGALGLAIVHFQFGFLTQLVYAAALLLTTVTSIPWRLKQPQQQLKAPNLRLTLVATVGGAAGKGLLTTIGTYLALGPQSLSFSPALLLAMASFSVASMVISVSKDGLGVGSGKSGALLPSVNLSLASLLGARTICFGGAAALLATLAVGVVAAVLAPWAFKPQVLIPGHLLLAVALTFQLWSVTAANFSKAALESFYHRGLWLAYYGQCALLPFL